MGLTCYFRSCRRLPVNKYYNSRVFDKSASVAQPSKCLKKGNMENETLLCGVIELKRRSFDVTSVNELRSS